MWLLSEFFPGPVWNPGKGFLPLNGSTALWIPCTKTEMACRGDAGFLYRFYKDILEEAGGVKLTDSAYVKDVMVQEREGNGKKYKFFMNFSEKGRSIEGEHLDGYEVKIRELDAEG